LLGNQILGWGYGLYPASFYQVKYNLTSKKQVVVQWVQEMVIDKQGCYVIELTF
jgi:hypothetical protein